MNVPENEGEVSVPAVESGVWNPTNLRLIENVLVTVTEFPALSVAVALTVCDPNVVVFSAVPFAGEPEQLANPDSESAQVNCIVIDVPKDRLEPFVGDVIVTVGGTVSTLTDLLANVVLPAASVQLADAIWFAPLELKTTGGGVDGMPDNASEQAKFTVTAVLFQPFAFASGACATLASGGVLSILTGGVV